MGKSPAKWIKTVLFGKKSSKSSSSKNVIIERRASTKESESVPLPAAPDLPQVVDQGTETIELESPCDATSPVSVKGSPKFDDTETLKLEQAATKAQSVFRGYLARRAFRALKGIIRLQALIRGHLVRRQAVATLHCMQSIVKLQALARGRKVRVLYPGHLLSKVTYAARMEVSGNTVGSQKLTTNAFVMKLHSSLPTAMPLSLQYDPSEPNSARNWLERWSTMRFWEPPLPQQKKKPSLKAQSKRTVKRVSAETDKPRRNPRKVTSHHSDSVAEQPQNELERVKRSLRKVSASSGLTSETSEIEIEKAHDNVPKESISPAPDVSEQGPEDSSEKLPDPEIVEKPLVIEDPPKTTTVEEPIDVENGEKVEIEPSVDEEMSAKDHRVSKDNSQKTRRRRSLPTKQEYTENVSQDSPILPSYMAATKSAKAKLRAQGASKVEEEGNGVENSYVRRHSLPSSTNGKKSSSPRVHRPLQANGKGGNKNIKPHTSSKDDKTQSGWKR